MYNKPDFLWTVPDPDGGDHVDEARRRRCEESARTNGESRRCLRARLILHFLIAVPIRSPRQDVAGANEGTDRLPERWIARARWTVECENESSIGRKCTNTDFSDLRRRESAPPRGELSALKLHA